ncbi:MAG TPA: pyridoxine 5'-phosphate synthase [Thermoanaerobaculia bacterium]|nr:pyridoxine 5'-phosphate synthase [Thermoanaerobaculia bacterium]
MNENESAGSGETRPSGRAALSVNVDHVATLRQARHADYPDPVAAATLAEEAGAAGITVHLREDRRHIQDHDVERLRDSVRGKLNLEMVGTEEMLRLALRVRPHQVTLVPERPDEVTTEGGLDLRTQARRIQRITTSLVQGGIAVSIFLDPEQEQLDALATLDNVAAFEINTDRYTKASGDDARRELDKISQIAAAGAAARLAIYAGHGLTTANVGPVAAHANIEELNIGHSIVSRAVLVGMSAAVREMLDAIG